MNVFSEQHVPGDAGQLVAEHGVHKHGEHGCHVQQGQTHRQLGDGLSFLSFLLFFLGLLVEV